MLRFIWEFQKYVGITGFSNVKINGVDEFLREIQSEEPSDFEVQILNAQLIATWRHLYFAVLNAMTAFRNGTNISKSLALETMLYASAQHQIRKSAKILGIGPKTSRLAVLVVGRSDKTVRSALRDLQKKINGAKDETVLALTKKKIEGIQKVFGISQKELGAVQKGGLAKEGLVKLVIERMALLAIER